MSDRKPVGQSAEYVRALDTYAAISPKAAADLYKSLSAQCYAKFKLAIIASLPEELAALQAAADAQESLFHELAEIHYDVLHFRSKLDGQFHEVILARVVSPGASGSAIAAFSALKDFRSIEDLIVVGVAGGIPNPEQHFNDVRVGDIVVSTAPIAEYDMTKIKESRIFRSYEAPPPSIQLTALVQQLEADRVQKKSTAWEPNLPRCCVIENGARPRIEADAMTQLRRYPEGRDLRRKGEMPVVHYGTIAAANPLARKSDLRDELGSLGVLAVERAGSGFADAAWIAGRGYLIIRGIYDYCEGTEDHTWKAHASACAAAYLRAIVGAMPRYTH